MSSQTNCLGQNQLPVINNLYTNKIEYSCHNFENYLCDIPSSIETEMVSSWKRDGIGPRCLFAIVKL